MKKILLGTTALVALVAASAMAEGPTVTVGGKFKFEAGYGDQKDVYDVNNRDTKFINDTKVAIKVNGKADNGLGYGAFIQLQGDVSDASDNTGENADKTYLFLESGLGRVELGSNYGPSKTLKVDASTFARATGGVDGDWHYFVNTTPGSNAFVVSPDLPLDAGVTASGDTENANKITYYSPRYAGLQFGVSFIPDSGNRGTAAGFEKNNNSNNDNQYENVFDLGLNYTNQYNQVGVSASLTSQLGDAENTAREDLRSYALGASVSYAGFTVGGSYVDWMDSGTAKGSNNDDNNLWTLGAAYVQGPVGASVSYLNSDYQNNDFDNWAIGADYQLAPGLVPYAEVSFFDLDPAGTAASNSGTVFLLGTQLNF